MPSDHIKPVYEVVAGKKNLHKTCTDCAQCAPGFLTPRLFHSFDAVLHISVKNQSRKPSDIRLPTE